MHRTSGLLLAAFPVLTALDIPGAGEAPVPGPLPEAWLSWQNDGFGPSFGLDSDDHRTNGFSAGATWKGFVLAVDSSMLTDRDEDGGGLRVDELTATLGYDSMLGWLRIRSGAGARATGNLGGEMLQYRAHRFLGQERFDLVFERETLTWDPLIYGRLGLEVPLWGILRLEPRALGLVTADGQSQSQAGARLVAAGPGGSWWAGADQQWRRGDAPTDTQQLVAKVEQGTWMAAGLAIDLPPWQIGFTFSRNLRNDEQQGAFLFGGAPDAGSASEDRWRGEFGMMHTSTGEKGRGQEYRLLWGSRSLPRIELLTDVRDWAYSTEDPDNLSARAISLGGGARASWRTDAPGWTPVLAFDAGLAWHSARIRATGPVQIDGGPSHEERTAVVHGGPAAGIGYRAQRGIAGDILMALDARQPLRTTTVRIAARDGSEAYDYRLVEREIVPVLRATVTISW